MLQFLVSHLQTLMGMLKFLCCPVTMVDEDREEHNDDQQRYSDGDKLQAGEVSLLLGYLCLLLLGVVEGGQLGGLAVFLFRDGRVENRQNLCASHHGRVSAPCLRIGLIFGQ